LVDGVVVGTIRDGQTVDFSIPAGRHEVRLKLDWTGSRVLSVEVGVGEVAHVACGPAGSALMGSFGVFACLGKNGRPWIDLHPVSDHAPADALDAVPADFPPGDHLSQPSVGADTSRFSVASLVLGIVWVGGVGSILAIIFGSVAKNHIDRSAGRQGGRSLAVAGIVLGWLGVALVPLIVAAVAFNNVATNPKIPDTPAVLSRAAAAQAYLAAIRPVNSAVDTFGREAAQWTNQTTDAHAARQAQPAIVALQHLRHKLVSTVWPSLVQHDATTLASDTVPIVGDLQALATVNLADASSWEMTFGRDDTIAKAADNRMRLALGLPPSPTATNTATRPGTSTAAPTNTPAVPAPNTSVTSSSSTNTPGGSQSGSGGGTGSGNGQASCFGCVTITTVTWQFYPGPDIPSVYQHCISASTTDNSNTQVVGPHVTNPRRAFTYTVHYTNGCPPGSIDLTIGKVDLQGANPPISISSTDPAVPFTVAPHATQALTVTFTALDGNYYNGPLVIDVIVD
jgi:uncharacterized membrane protein YgcG